MHFDTNSAQLAGYGWQRDLVDEVWVVLLLQAAVGPMT